MYLSFCPLAIKRDQTPKQQHVVDCVTDPVAMLIPGKTIVLKGMKIDLKKVWDVSRKGFAIGYNIGSNQWEELYWIAWGLLPLRLM